MNEKSQGATKFEVNFLADLLEEELSAYFGNLDAAPLEESPNFDDLDSDENGRMLVDLSPINWVEDGHTHPVKDQGVCGSCVPFTVATVMESLISIKATNENEGELVAPKRLSESHLLDCAKADAKYVVGKNYGNYGCDGGFIQNYSQFVKE